MVPLANQPLPANPDRCAWALKLPKTTRAALADGVIFQRAVRKWTQKQLGAESGISESTLNAIERGEANDIKLTTFVSLVECFECEPAYLLTGQQPRHATPTGIPSAGHACENCGFVGQARHSTGEWLVSLANEGKSINFLMSEFQMTREAIELVMGDEYTRMRRMKPRERDNRQV